MAVNHDRPTLGLPLLEFRTANHIPIKASLGDLGRVCRLPKTEGDTGISDNRWSLKTYLRVLDG